MSGKDDESLPLLLSESSLDLHQLVWYIVGYKEGRPMKNMIIELWRGNLMPPEDSRQNSPEMQQLLEYISRHNDDLQKTMTDEQKEIFEKFHDCWSEYASLSDEAIFEYAFKLGMRLAIETFVE